MSSNIHNSSPYSNISKWSFGYVYFLEKLFPAPTLSISLSIHQQSNRLEMKQNESCIEFLANDFSRLTYSNYSSNKIVNHENIKICWQKFWTDFKKQKKTFRVHLINFTNYFCLSVKSINKYFELYFKIPISYCLFVFVRICSNAATIASQMKKQYNWK